jgi:hypothetical protein
MNQQIMAESSLTALIGDQIQGNDKWWDFVDGKDGFFAKEGCNETFYDSAVRKFGIEKVFEFLVEECLPWDKECADSFSGNLPLFMVNSSLVRE